MIVISNSIINILILFAGILILAVFWYTALKSMERYVSKIKIKYISSDTKLFQNLKVYFKNFDSSKNKQFFPSISSYQDPLYSFNLCDLYFNSNSILLVGKIKSFGRLKDVNITVFEKNQINTLGVALKAIHATKTHLHIEFEDDRYDKNITAMIRMPEEEEMYNVLVNGLK